VHLLVSELNLVAQFRIFKFLLGFFQRRYHPTAWYSSICLKFYSGDA